ncbi:helix-turn-helix domain-containing protein [Photobacterium leiognathi]|uniref:helix-turn-helix domain-containing protein n=1 Tax=Photobacterium leiognathi TaxID=553611 RepID=UPI00387EDD32
MDSFACSKFYRVIGDELRFARSNKGLSQVELFLATNISRETISRIECGSRRVSVHHLCILCEYLDVPIEKIIKKGMSHAN